MGAILLQLGGRKSTRSSAEIKGYIYDLHQLRKEHLLFQDVCLLITLHVSNCSDDLRLQLLVVEFLDEGSDEEFKRKPSIGFEEGREFHRSVILDILIRFLS